MNINEEQPMETKPVYSRAYYSMGPTIILCLLARELKALVKVGKLYNGRKQGL